MVHDGYARGDELVLHFPIDVVQGSSDIPYAQTSTENRKNRTNFPHLAESSRLNTSLMAQYLFPYPVLPWTLGYITAQPFGEEAMDETNQSPKQSAQKVKSSRGCGHLPLGSTLARKPAMDLAQAHVLYLITDTFGLFVSIVAYGTRSPGQSLDTLWSMDTGKDTDVFKSEDSVK
jgi:hypothetical protein